MLAAAASLFLLVRAHGEALQAPPPAHAATAPTSSDKGDVLLRVLIALAAVIVTGDRKSTRLNSSHLVISYAVFCLKKKKLSSHPSHFGLSATWKSCAGFSYSCTVTNRHHAGASHPESVRFRTSLLTILTCMTSRA